MIAVHYSTQSFNSYLSEEKIIYTDSGSGLEKDLIADISDLNNLNLKQRKHICDDIQSRDFWGTCYLLTRGHLPYDVVLDNQLTDQVLGRYKVLVYPNSACLSDEQVGAIKRFVSKGGGLIADFETGPI